MEHILVPTDGSEGAIEAARLAAAMAEKFGARVTILHASQIPSSFMLGVAPPVAEISEFLEVVAKESVDNVRAAFDEKGISYDTEVRNGSPATVIVDFAAENDVDLIVIGHRGLSGFERFLLGSVSGKVVNHAPCAVLVAAPAREGE